MIIIIIFMYCMNYNKYKSKYLEIKNQSKLIIHVSGPSGAGKTTLGNKLKQKYGNKITVKDVDQLRKEFINKTYGDKFTWKLFESDKYQKFIDDYIYKHHKPIVFVGLNNYPWHKKNLYYNMHSNYNFYIDLDDKIILQQRCRRFITDQLQDMINNKDIIDQLVNNNQRFIDGVTNGLKYECGLNKIIKMNKDWNKNYKKQGYKFMSREDIYKKITSILK